MGEPDPADSRAPTAVSGPDDTRALLPPIRHVSAGAPLAWLAAGWADFRFAWKPSVFYGIVFAAMGWLVAWVFSNAYAYVWGLTSGFLLLGPFLAIGLYELSRQRGRGEAPRLRPTLMAWRPNVGSIGMFALVLGVLLLLWSRASLVVIAVAFPSEMPSLQNFMADALSPKNLEFLLTWLAVGSVFALLVFAIAVVSVPMMLDRNTDGIVASITSLAVVRANIVPMLVWGALITVLTVAGFALFYLGLIVAVPVIGHATWHAYRELVG